LKTRNFGDWVRGLSELEIGALRAYKSETENLKRFLLGTDQTPGLSAGDWTWTTDHVTALDAAIAKLEHPAGTKLWCAVAEGARVRNLIADGVYRFAPYISVSKTQALSYRFFTAPIANPILLQFDMDREFVAAQLPPREGIGDGEHEIVLPRNTAYRVVADNQTIPFNSIRRELVRFAKEIVTVVELKPM